MESSFESLINLLKPIRDELPVVSFHPCNMGKEISKQVDEPVANTYFGNQLYQQFFASFHFDSRSSITHQG